jgi:predicted peptidase
MTKLLAASLVGLMATPLLALRTETGFLDRAVTIRGDVYRYQVYVPAEYAGAKSWPLLVDLHGNGSQGSDGIRQTAHFLADEIRMHRSRFPLIALFPQATVGATWTTGAMPTLIDAAIDITMREFRINTARVYLSGFSMGAEGVYSVAARSSWKFAAAFAIAGPVHGDVAMLAQSLRGLPIHIFHGADDERVPVEQSRGLVAALERVGAPVIYTEYSGTRHGPAAEKAYADEALFNWLLAQSRPDKASRKP